MPTHCETRWERRTVKSTATDNVAYLGCERGVARLCRFAQGVRCCDCAALLTPRLRGAFFGGMTEYAHLDTVLDQVDPIQPADDLLG